MQLGCHIADSMAEYRISLGWLRGRWDEGAVAGFMLAYAPLKVTFDDADIPAVRRR